MNQMTLSDMRRPRTQLFMVRVWLEDLGDGETEWRGQVKHVLSGEVRYFREWSGLVEHIRAIAHGMSSNKADNNPALPSSASNVADGVKSSFTSSKDTIDDAR